MGNRTITNEQQYLLETLYKETMPALMAYARRFVSEDVARDMVQDIFLKVWQSRRSLLNISDIHTQQAYLLRSVHNACCDWVKHQIAVSNHVDETLYLLKLEELEDQQERGFELLEERIKKVRKISGTLPERCREIFLMHYRQGKKSAEIARFFGISKKTVEVQLYKALQILRKTLR